MRTPPATLIGLACLSVAILALSRSAHCEESDAIAPTQVVQLFNGRDLSGLYPWLKATGGEDPKTVFSVRDGLLHVSGEDMGYLATEKAYRDYHLVIEFKWGERTYGAKYVRNSGVLLHGTGPDQIWMNCIECQLAQGCVGDFIVIRGKDPASRSRPATISSETTLGPDRRTRWLKGGQKTIYAGKQFWWSFHDPDFKELIDTRGRNDVESPLGEWTRVECLCKADRITVLVNGQTVNECFDVVPSAGKILLQSEGFEVLFRKFELRPLK